MECNDTSLSRRSGLKVNGDEWVSVAFEEISGDIPGEPEKLYNKPGYTM